MILTPAQIQKIGQDAIDAVPAIKAVLDAGKAALDAHNHTKGAKRVETGSVVLCQGAVATILEQAKRHITDNAPAPAATAPDGSPAATPEA